MNILDLEEAAGLRMEDVRAYLERKGWHFRDPRINGGVTCWPPRPGTGSTYVFTLRPTADSPEDRAHLELTLFKLVQYERRTLQAILREMNPRMRRGLPSIAAWEAHGGNSGYWVARWDVGRDITGEEFGWFSRRPFITQLRRQRVTWEWGLRGVGFYNGPGDYPEKNWLFWPCDEHGNKVPWPRGADGREL